MANISPKFGVVRLSVRCGGQVDVKITQNRNWTETTKKKKSGKKKKIFMMVLGGIDPGAQPRRL